MAEISHSEDQRNAGVTDSVISHWIHPSGCYKSQTDYDGWRWRMEDLVNLSCKVFVGFNIFPRYTALSRRYEDSRRSGKHVPFYPCGKVGPEAVSTHMEMNQSAQVQIWHQTVPVFDNVIWRKGNAFIPQDSACFHYLHKASSPARMSWWWAHWESTELWNGVSEAQPWHQFREAPLKRGVLCSRIQCSFMLQCPSRWGTEVWEPCGPFIWARRDTSESLCILPLKLPHMLTLNRSQNRVHQDPPSFSKAKV